eukprot:951569_1
MSLIVSLIVVIHAAMAAADSNMNRGGVPYGYSNPPGSTPNWKGTEGSYSTQFNSNVEGKVEHFDVYGEVRTNYSQVYWTRNLPINLPSDLVARFKDKVMVITGYEVDQVTHNGPEPGSTTTTTELGGFSCYPSCDTNGEDKSVPIFNAYNHHYFGWITSEYAEIYTRETPIDIPNPTSVGFRAKNGGNYTYPLSIVFKENPGGEFRKSYHGYASGYGQLIYSPSQWIVEPMQVDTHNRDYDINDLSQGYVPSLLPKAFTDNNMTDLGSGLSPLIECPCTDRITKTKIKTPIILSNGTCGTQRITSKSECMDAAADAGIIVDDIKTINDPSQSTGCSIQPVGTTGKYTVIYNTNTAKQTCGTANNDNPGVTGSANLGNLTTLSIDHVANGADVTITLSGPSSVWYGVGFNATTMADEPYAIIIDGTGAVSERTLGDHSPGTLLPPSITIQSNAISNGIRTVTLTRPVKGMSFHLQTGSLNVITAIGSTVELSYHKARTAASIVLLPTSTDACVCKPQVQSFLTYMDQQRSVFGYKCLDAPRSDMLKKGDGTQRYGIQNAACDVDTYHGGLVCCHHKSLLTDKAQESQIPKDKTDKYFLKWRYYFQEYVPAKEAAKASHKHLHHWVFLIDDRINDYEEDNIESEYGIEGIGKISANLTVRGLGLEDIGTAADAATADDNGGIAPVPFDANTTIMPLVMTPHCHAPSCIRQEIWNVDTGQILCNMTARYGSAEYGSVYDIFNEPNYITIVPCIFGYQPGLQYPFVLTPDTNITAVKYFNNTWRHLGQMAQWTGLLVYSTDPY